MSAVPKLHCLWKHHCLVPTLDILGSLVWTAVLALGLPEAPRRLHEQQSLGDPVSMSVRVSSLWARPAAMHDPPDGWKLHVAFVTLTRAPGCVSYSRHRFPNCRSRVAVWGQLDPSGTLILAEANREGGRGRREGAWVGAVVHPAQDGWSGAQWPASNLGLRWFILCVNLIGLRGAWGAGCICEAVSRRD